MVNFGIFDSLRIDFSLENSILSILSTLSLILNSYYLALFTHYMTAFRFHVKFCLKQNPNGYKLKKFHSMTNHHVQLVNYFKLYSFAENVDDLRNRSWQTDNTQSEMKCISKVIGGKENNITR